MLFVCIANEIQQNKTISAGHVDNKYYNHIIAKLSFVTVHLGLKLLLSACVRKSKAKPVAWGLFQYDGQMGMGHTLAEYRRKQLNRIINHVSQIGINLHLP